MDHLLNGNHLNVEHKSIWKVFLMDNGVSTDNDAISLLTYLLGAKQKTNVLETVFHVYFRNKHGIKEIGVNRLTSFDSTPSTIAIFQKMSLDCAAYPIPLPIRLKIPTVYLAPSVDDDLDAAEPELPPTLTDKPRTKPGQRTANITQSDRKTQVLVCNEVLPTIKEVFKDKFHPRLAKDVNGLLSLLADFTKISPTPNTIKLQNMKTIAESGICKGFVQLYLSSKTNRADKRFALRQWVTTFTLKQINQYAFCNNYNRGNKHTISSYYWSQALFDYAAYGVDGIRHSCEAWGIKRAKQFISADQLKHGLTFATSSDMLQSISELTLAPLAAN